jgi:hypothetical protein
MNIDSYKVHIKLKVLLDHAEEYWSTGLTTEERKQLILILNTDTRYWTLKMHTEEN